MYVYIYICIHVIWARYINRRKFRSQTSDNMDRWKAEQGRGREKRKIRREKIRRERVRRKKMQMREKVGKSRNTVFFQWFGAPEGRKVGSLKRRVRSQLARWEMKICRPLWREAHFEVKMYKTHHCGTTFGSCDVEKVHVVVARSTFPSQNVQNTPAPDHFWRFRCRKSARRCGAKHVSKSKCTKHLTVGRVLEVEMSKKCTPLWRKAHVQVKMYKTPHCRKNTRGLDYFWRFRCLFASLHYNRRHHTTLHYTTLHSTTLQLQQRNYTPLHSTTLHYTTLHSTTLQLQQRNYTPLRSTTLHYTPLHSTTLHYTPLHSTTPNYTTLHSTTPDYTTLHYLPLHLTTLHYITLHYTTLHYTTLHYTTTTTAQLHSTTLHYTTLHYLPLHLTTLHYITLHSTTLQLQLHNYTPLH